MFLAIFPNWQKFIPKTILSKSKEYRSGKCAKIVELTLLPQGVVGKPPAMSCSRQHTGVADRFKARSQLSHFLETYAHQSKFP